MIADVDLGVDQEGPLGVRLQEFRGGAVRAGTGMSAERERIQSAEILRRVEGNTGCTDMARSSRALRRLRTEARMYVIYRDLGDLRVALAGRRQGRKGKARSRNRR